MIVNAKSIYSGFIAIVGRPNVGKSTLLNQIIGQKISIATHKAQTTRHNIVGIKTKGNKQWIFIDTPGIHQESKNRLNAIMNKNAKVAIRDVDVIVMVVEANIWTNKDEYVLNQIKQSQNPVVLVINKIDKLTNKDILLKYISNIHKNYNFDEIVPLSAFEHQQTSYLTKVLLKYLKSDHFFYAEKDLTDKDTNFRITELIREKLFQHLYNELPYELTVELELIEKKNKHFRVYAIIWVSRISQKKVVIGKSGQLLKKIGSAARFEIELLLKNKVMLKLWVKVKSEWPNNDIHLKNFKYKP